MPELREYSHRYFLTAGKCDASQKMPLSLVARHVIEVATEHANALGAGYATLIANNEAWVLSRLTIEMKRYPGINEEYEVTTWIEGFNRHFSERNFEIKDGTGEVIGYARSVWFAINIDTRQPADIARLHTLGDNVSNRLCPIEKQSRLRPVASPTMTEGYRFRYSDIDFNRHVNTVRYMELVLNQWDMDWYDRYDIARFEMAFLHEAHFGDEATVPVEKIGEEVYAADILVDEKAICRSKIVFRQQKQHISV